MASHHSSDQLPLQLPPDQLPFQLPTHQLPSDPGFEHPLLKPPSRSASSESLHASPVSEQSRLVMMHAETTGAAGAHAPVRLYANLREDAGDCGGEAAGGWCGDCDCGGGELAAQCSSGSRNLCFGGDSDLQGCDLRGLRLSHGLRPTTTTHHSLLSTLYSPLFPHI